jgi:hypothetical protein
MGSRIILAAPRLGRWRAGILAAGSPSPEPRLRSAAARLQGFALPAFGFWLAGCPWLGSSLPILS